MQPYEKCIGKQFYCAENLNIIWISNFGLYYVSKKLCIYKMCMLLLLSETLPYATVEQAIVCIPVDSTAMEFF